MITDPKAESFVLVGLLDAVIPYEEAISEIDESHFAPGEGRDMFNLFLTCRNFDRFTKAMLLSQTQNPALKAYIEQVNRMSVNKAEAQFFMEKLKHTKLRNECIDKAQKVIQLAQRETTTHDELVQALHETAMNNIEGRSKKDILFPEKYAEEHKAAYLERYKNPEQFQGIPLAYRDKGETKGFPQWNQTLMGLRGGDLIMICAKSGDGKTALALNVSRILSVEQDFVTYYLNMEMSDQELGDRLAAMISMVPATEIYTGVHDDSFNHLAAVKAYDRVKESKIILSQIPVLKVSKAKALSQIVRKQMQGLDCLIVDYIGRMEPDKSQGEQEWQQLYRVAENLKTAAIELNIPIIALAQLNEAGMLEGAKKMKNACDGVFFFVPTNDKDQDFMERDILRPERRRLVNYKLVKYKVRRNDSTSPIWCNFNKKYQLVSEV